LYPRNQRSRLRFSAGGSWVSGCPSTQGVRPRYRTACSLRAARRSRHALKASPGTGSRVRWSSSCFPVLVVQLACVPPVRVGPPQSRAPAVMGQP